MSRATPFDLVFGGLAEERFPAVRESLGAADATDRDTFMLDREVVSLLREQVPDEGADAAVTEHLALLHHAYLFWAAGKPVTSLTRPVATALLREPAAPSGGPSGERYIQFPERLVWAETDAGAPHEPLDGVFAHRGADGVVSVLGVFGFHATRLGFSVVSAEGVAAESLARADGSALFAPVLPGGSAAGLFSITGPEELLALASRALGADAGKETRTG